jgi:hypothetical protein
MAHYFFALDAAMFEGRARPVLAESWRRRTFGPCQSLCESLLPSAREYAERYRTGPEEALLSRVAQTPDSIRFDRHLWRALVGEILLYGASEIPEFQISADTFCCLLAPDQYLAQITERARLAPIQQVHHGSRDLTFGAAVYRPEKAGYNNRADVARLAEYLEGIDANGWSVADLSGLREPLDEEERADELAFAREWFPALRDLYRRMRDRGQVLAIEQIY